MSKSERVQNLLANASELPPEQRAAFLDSACQGDLALRAEVDSLLKSHDQAGQFLATPTADVPEAAHAAVTSSATRASTTSLHEGPGTRIGHYKLLQLIGEGGFGTVFMAEQERPVVRKVALKIIKLGMDTRQVVARFEQERQALAMMDHPNIARVLDAGATETGRPFFVMELVKGDPIVEYCDKNNLRIQDRLELFAQVCNAVQHAHTKGIIHRDIKPSNILVSTQDGRPHTKVVDFGIAKATASKLTEKTLFTEMKQLIGTPEYMSPEQAEGNLDIDTRTDVYSLGVLLYELLTGTTPFSAKELRSAAYGEIQRIIREVDPPKPSTRLSNNTDTIASVATKRHTEPKRLGTIVRGELDWIVMKALEKDRQRRYETANGMAMDIRRYLSGEAVVAAPPSTAYRFKKFVRRNRVMVTAASVVAAALIAISVVTAVAAFRLNQQKQELAREKSISDQRLNTYRSTVSQLVNQAPNLLKGAPVGSGAREELLTLLQSALQQPEDTGAVGPSRLYGLAAVSIREGERLLDQAVAEQGRSDRLDITTDRLKQAAEQFDEADRIFREVYDSRPEDMSKAAANLATGLSRIVILQSLQKKPFAELVPVYKRVIELRREALSAVRSDDGEVIAQRKAELGKDLTAYADVLMANRPPNDQRFASRALELTTESCGLLKEALSLLPATSNNVQNARQDLGSALILRARGANALDQFEEAGRAYAEAVDICQQLCTDFPNRYVYRDLLTRAANAYGDFLLYRDGDAKQIAVMYSIAMQALARTLDEPELRQLQHGENGLAMQHYRIGLAESLEGNSEKATEAFVRCALLRELAWHDSLNGQKDDEGSDRLISQRIELMLAQARCGRADSAIGHAQWLVERAKQLSGNNPDDRLTAAGFGADQLFLFAASGFGLASEHIPPERREAIVQSAIESTSIAIQRGFRDWNWLQKNPDFDPLRQDARFQKLLAALEAATKAPPTPESK